MRKVDYVLVGIHPIEEDVQQDGISWEFMRFIEGRTTCAGCNEVVHSIGAHFKCENVSDGMGTINTVCPGDQLSAFEWFVERENRRKKRMVRKSLARKSKFVHTQKQVAELFEKQMRSCFYCGGEFEESKAGLFLYHRDHYVALASGGTDHIHNIVLACPGCNKKKGAMDACYFERELSKHFSVGQSKRVANIQWEVRGYKISKKVWANPGRRLSSK